MNKPTPSEITTFPRAQSTKIGMQLGERGLETLASLDELPKHATPEIAQRMMGSLPAFSARRSETEDELQLAKEVCRYLEEIPPRKWIAGRVVTLLSHYFVAQTDSAVAEAMADDWCEMLEDYPAWAIANACRWWMSRENPRKHCKPLPGDIQERAHVEMMPVRAARIMILQGIQPKQSASEAMRQLSPEEMESRRKFGAEVAARFARDHSAGLAE